MDNEIDEIAWPEETNNASENQLSGYNESDTDGEIVNVNEVALTIDDLFNDWESVQVIIDSYAKQNGFVVVKSRKDVDPIDKSIIRRREYICWKSGTHQSKKVEDISLYQDCSSSRQIVRGKLVFILGKSRISYVLPNLYRNIIINVIQKPSNWHQKIYGFHNRSLTKSNTTPQMEI
ncbi:unnamed protein product [Rhizophagus irregularis]|uniref:FAR1 domain-containing protein n=1 Tax=Rhizophagus irregularis TaxID=588596 RepID=A0A915ZC10_9GLOM|nr:unnamed protein product [Rhizophagus irregularis]CAB5368710.1 unnamed protein product [Rhizophagus irregularis]